VARRVLASAAALDVTFPRANDFVIGKWAEALSFANVDPTEAERAVARHYARGENRRLQVADVIVMARAAARPERNPQVAMLVAHREEPTPEQRARTASAAAEARAALARAQAEGRTYMSRLAAAERLRQQERDAQQDAPAGRENGHRAAGG
jgi:hypothetical protein